jgi:hypothetical protein
VKRDYRFRVTDPNSYFVQGNELDAEATEYKSKPLLRLGAPSINNLALTRSGLPLLTGEEETKLLQTGQYREVVLRHIPWIRAQARKRWDVLNPKKKMGSASTVTSLGSTAIDLVPPKQERSVQFDDFVATCALALWEAIVQWRPSNNKLNAFARKFILGALSDIAADWRNKHALQMDSRIQRFIQAHPFWKAEWIQARFYKLLSIQEIEDEQQRAYGAYQQISYVEEVADEDETNEAYREFTAAFQASQRTTTDIHGVSHGPQSQWSRDAARGFMWKANGAEDRNVITWSINRRKYIRASIWDDRIEANFNERAAARLEFMGRNGYANWLVNRRSTYPKPSNEPPALFQSLLAGYWNAKPPIVAELTAVDGRNLKPLPIVGPGQPEDSFWNEREPSKLCRSLKTINMTPPIAASVSIVPSYPIDTVSILGTLEGIDEPTRTTHETSVGGRKPRQQMARTRLRD